MKKSPRLVSLFLVIAVLSAGCSTTAMKGTPFFTGEYGGRVGPAEDRVNLWPLVYWRDPALSVLWPIGEVADDRFAVRPLYSRYRKKADGPFTETNILWPLVHFDTSERDYRVFPYFWGSLGQDGAYHVLFPLFWDYRRPAAQSGCQAFFPLWIHDWNKRNGWSETDVLWPIFNFESGPNRKYVRVFPLFGHSRNTGTGDGFDWGLAGLLGHVKDGSDEAYWCAPFFYRDVDDGALYTLLWSGANRHGDGWWVIPVLLSAGRYNSDGSSAGALLLGLGGWRSDGHAHWMFPLWYRDKDSFFSMPWARWIERGAWVEVGSWDSFAMTTNTWYTPLVGSIRGARKGSWFLPFWIWWDGTGPEYNHNVLLIANSQRFGDMHDAWFFPFWHRVTRGAGLDALAAEASALELPPGDWGYDLPNDGTDGAHPKWTAKGQRDTSWLLGFIGASHSVSRAPLFAHRNPVPRDIPNELGHSDAKDAASTNPPVFYQERKSNWFFPLWHSRTWRETTFDSVTRKRAAEREFDKSALLWFLYDYRHESASAHDHEYVRHRVLWRLYHDERLNGDRTIDVFPGITIDRKQNGYRKTSFLWRLFRYENDPEKGRSLDLLFLPILRP